MDNNTKNMHLPEWARGAQRDNWKMGAGNGVIEGPFGKATITVWQDGDVHIAGHRIAVPESYTALEYAEMLRRAVEWGC